MLTLESMKDTLKRSGWYQPGSKILVACSGGLDSIVLLHLLHGLDVFELHILHFNHGLRAAESDRDEAFIRELAKNIDIPVSVVSEDIKSVAKDSNVSVEEAGSIRRNRIFEEYARELGCDWIATAHHADDQLETILINLYLGSGIRGMQGIGGERGITIRPLLEFRRSEIEKYAHDMAIEYKVDQTNLEQDYLRNYIRLSLIPALSENIQASLQQEIIGLTAVSSVLNRYIEDSLEVIDNKEVSRHSGVKISLGLIATPNYFSPIQKAIFDSIFQELSAGTQGISENHFESLRVLMKSGEPGSEIHLPGGVKAVRDRKQLTFLHATDLEWVMTDLGIGNISFPFFRLNSGDKGIESHLKDPFLFWPKAPLSDYKIRMVQAGDRLLIQDEKYVGVNQVLQEARVASHLKSYFPVLVYQNEVVWVPGVRTSINAYVDDADLENENMKYIKVRFDEGTFE